MNRASASAGQTFQAQAAPQIKKVSIFGNILFHAAPKHHASLLYWGHVLHLLGTEFKCRQYTAQWFLQISFEDLKGLPYNEVTLLGNLGSDLQIRSTSTGKDVGSVNMAVNTGTAEDKVSTWFKLTLWEDLARQGAGVLAKGTRVWVKGRLSIKSYQPANGPAKESTEVTVKEIHIVQ